MLQPPYEYKHILKLPRLLYIFTFGTAQLHERELIIFENLFNKNKKFRKYLLRATGIKEEDLPKIMASQRQIDEQGENKLSFETLLDMIGFNKRLKDKLNLVLQPHQKECLLDFLSKILVFEHKY